MEYEELRQQLVDVLFDDGIVALKGDLEKAHFKPEMSLIKHLAMDSIQLLTYLLSIEQKYHLSLDYEDLTIEVFDNFNEFVKYFFDKINQEGQIKYS